LAHPCLLYIELDPAATPKVEIDWEKWSEHGRGRIVVDVPFYLET